MGSVRAAEKSANLYKAARRIERGKGTDEDKATVEKFIADSEADANRSFGSKVVDTISRIPATAAEFAMSGGAGAAGKAAAKKALGEAAEKTVGKITAGAADLGARLAVNPQKIVESVTRESLPPLERVVDARGKTVEINVGDAPSFLEALPAGFADAAIEMGTELAGGELMKGAGRVLSKLPIADRLSAIRTGIIGRYLAKPGASVKKLNETLAKGGWHGAIAELGEERLADIARLTTGLESENVTSQLVTGDWKPALEQLAVEGLAFGLLGGSVAGARKVASTIDQRSAKAVQDAVAFASSKPDQVAAVVEAGDNGKAFQAAVGGGRQSLTYRRTFVQTLAALSSESQAAPAQTLSKLS